MKWKIDLGLNNGGGGPWLSWHPQASRNGERSPNTWALRSADGEVVTTNAPSHGFILDLEMIKTGWESASGRSGVAPERKWNAAADRYAPQPGPDWKRAFSLPVVLTKDQRATWEQASLAARIALDDLCKVLDADPGDHGEQVPLVRQTGAKLIRTAGGNTMAPILTLVRWVDRPAVLDQPDSEAAWDDDDLVQTAEPVGSDHPRDVPGVTDEGDYGVDPWAEAPDLPVAPAKPTRPPMAKAASASSWDRIAPAQPPSAAPSISSRERIQSLKALRDKAGANPAVSPVNGQAEPGYPTGLYAELLTTVRAHDPDFAVGAYPGPQDSFLHRLAQGVRALPEELRMSEAAEAWYDQAAQQAAAQQPITPPDGYQAYSPEQPEPPAKPVKPRSRRKSSAAAKPASDSNPAPEQAEEGG